MVVSLLARPLASRGRSREFLQFRARVRIKRAVQAALAPLAAPRLPPWGATLLEGAFHAARNKPVPGSLHGLCVGGATRHARPSTIWGRRLGIPRLAY